MIRQGGELLIPARIKSTSGFSNDVVNLTIGGGSINNNEMGSGLNLSESSMAIQRVQPIREPSVATLTKPISIIEKGGTVDPEFELSKRFPIVGYITRPLNLTVTVIPPSNIGDQFKEF